MGAARGVRVFISYAHADEASRARLRAHLQPLDDEGLVRAWDDRQIPAGNDWADEIDARLNEADVILLLVSIDFITSKYCRGIEMKRALERNANQDDRAIVIPVILRKCHWETSRFAHLQALPPGQLPLPSASPISDWKAHGKTEDDYYTAVAKGLRERIGQLVDPEAGVPGRAGQRLRDPPWWQRPRARAWAAAAVGVPMVVVAGAGWRWQQLATEADGEVALALHDLRSGRYADAVRRADSVCKRPISRQACFTLDKARLGSQLERPDTLSLERFGTQVGALRAKAPDDPDLMLFVAELALRKNPGDEQKRREARSVIERAIGLAGGDFPEAHYVLADLELRQGHHAAALPLLDRALASKSNRDGAPDHYLNARGYARLRTGDIAGAIDDYRQSAEQGSILSRIELAELLWRWSKFEDANNQLRTAVRDLGAADAPLTGRNTLPWTLETARGQPVVLKQPFEKRCLARWMLAAGLALAGQPGAAAGRAGSGVAAATTAADANAAGAADAAAAPPWSDCGPDATGIRLAIAASLTGAIDGGMDEAGRQRAIGFARQHNLLLPVVGANTGGG